MVNVTLTGDGEEADSKAAPDSDDGARYSLPSSSITSGNYASMTDEEDYFERQPLIQRSSRRRSKSPLTSPNRHRSISRSLSRSQTSTMSIWTLTRTQKLVLVTTCLCDFIAFLSISLMAPFFPEEVCYTNSFFFFISFTTKNGLELY